MNFVDVLIILVILFGAAVGYKSGFTKQLISFLGFIVVVAISYVLKNHVSKFLYLWLPFFNFGGIFKGVTVLNIVIYEVIAFMIVFSILMILFRVLLFASSLFESLLKFTIILGLPSKLLGAVVGIIEYTVIVFIALYIFTLPILHITGMENSKLKDKILYNTPILSHYTKDGLALFQELDELKDKYEVMNDANSFNLETLDLLLKYKVITPTAVSGLIESEKLNIAGADMVLSKYQEGSEG